MYKNFVELLGKLYEHLKYLRDIAKVFSTNVV